MCEENIPKIFIRDAGDIIDRWAISKLKAERIGTPENKREFEAFEEGKNYLENKYSNFEWNLICKLIYDVHDFLWKFESATKSGKLKLPDPTFIYNPDNKPILSDIGIIGLEVGNYNHIRIAIKNYINKVLEQGFQEIKKDHRSE
jgi:hypothetical protein